MQVAQIAAQSGGMSDDVRREMIEREIALRRSVAGLDQPFIRRSLTHLKNALTLNFGRARFMISDHGSRYVRNIILERLPATLLLMGTSQLLLFVVSLFLALAVSRHYGSFWDKLIVALSPTSSIPPWFYGIFLISSLLHGWRSAFWRYGRCAYLTKIGYFLSVLKHMILPAFSFYFEFLWSIRTLGERSSSYIPARITLTWPGQRIRFTRHWEAISCNTMPSYHEFALMLVGIWTEQL